MFVIDHLPVGQRIRPGYHFQQLNLPCECPAFDQIRDAIEFVRPYLKPEDFSCGYIIHNEMIGGYGVAERFCLLVMHCLSLKFAELKEEANKDQILEVALELNYQAFGLSVVDLANPRMLYASLESCCVGNIAGYRPNGGCDSAPLDICYYYPDLVTLGH